jgi:hypothetical protein
VEYFKLLMYILFGAETAAHLQRQSSLPSLAGDVFRGVGEEKWPHGFIVDGTAEAGRREGPAGVFRFPFPLSRDRRLPDGIVPQADPVTTGCNFCTSSTTMTHNSLNQKFSSQNITALNLATTEDIFPIIPNTSVVFVFLCRCCHIYLPFPLAPT